MKLILLAGLPVLLGIAAMSQTSSSHPSVAISNQKISAKLYLPDKTRGYYKGTRFDWSGVIYSLTLGKHDFYGPWFNKTDPGIHDFEYRGDDIVAGPCSATSGPADEFAEVGYDEAQTGGTFIKIGIGALRKPDAQPYDNYRLYEVADGGEWKVDPQAASVAFTQTLATQSSGYGYVYRKTVELVPGKAEMLLRHSLRNTGTKSIETNVYNHNFFVLDHQPPGASVRITLPFEIKSSKPPSADLATIEKNQIQYRKTLTGRDTVATPLDGFGPEAADNRFRIENTAAGAGMSAATDRPLLKEALWSIRSVIAVEPYVNISIKPGAEFDWTTRYDYYTLNGSE